MKKKHHTPFVLKTGFLHGYSRTVPILLLWLVITELILYASGVFVNSLFDPWTYIFVPIFLILTYVTRRTVSGYDALFGIMGDEFEQELELYSDLDVPSLTLEEVPTQERIRKIFVDQRSYEDFKNRVRGLVFSKYEGWLTATLLLAGPILLIVGWSQYSQVGLYGVILAPWWQLFVITNAVFGVLSIVALGSLFYIVITMIASISQLENHLDDLKVYKYISMLRDEENLDEIAASDLMGYDSFYSSTTPIGDFLYGITWRALIAVVLYVLNMVLFSYLRWLDIGVILYGYGIVVLVGAMVMFLWPQLGLHNLLSQRKSDIIDALREKRDFLSTKIIMVSAKLERHTGHRPMAELGKEVEVHEHALDRIQKIIDNLTAQSTWSFDYMSFVRMIGGAAMPLIATVLQDLATILGII